MKKLGICIVLALGAAPLARGQFSSEMEKLRALSRGGSVAEAESLAIALSSSMSPESAPLELAELQHFLANLHLGKGDLRRARAAADSALAMRRRSLPADDLQVAASLHLLGVIARRQAEFIEARSFYEESLAIREKQLGDEHIDIAWSLNNLANVFYDLGDFAQTAQLHRRALAIRESLLGPDHPDVAYSLNNLANAMMELGDVEGAAPLLIRSLSIREIAHGEEHVNVAQSLNNLALAYARLDDLAGADSLYARSVSIRETVLGADHPEVARSLLRHSFVREALGHTEEAIAMAQRALSLRRAGLGPEHPEFALCHMRMADILARQNRIGEATQHALAAEAISRRHFRRVISGLDEHAAFSFSGERTSGLDLLLELSGRNGAPANADSLALDALIRARALVLDEMMFRQGVVASAADPGTAPLAAGVIERQAEVAQLALDGPQDEGEAEFLSRLAASEEALAGAQRRLAVRSTAFGRLIASRGIGFLDVSQALSNDAALVCMARYTELGPASGAIQRGNEQYVAFVLRAGRTRPVRVALGDATRLDGLIDTWLALVRAAPDPLRRAAGERQLRAAGLAVRAQVFDPLSPYVAGARELFLVPDAALALVPFAALPGDSTGYLVEQLQTLHLLATERDLVEFTPTQHRGVGMLALGGVDYALARVPCAAATGASFPPLPGSLAEADAIAAFWRTDPGEQVETLRGASASEANFRRLSPGRRVLHLATHGFFLDSACLDARGAALAAPYRAGIVLSVGGASSRAAGGQLDGRDDGWLTAGEIAGLDLSGVEWAVLSACRTGRGEIVLAGEELLGLRRALRIAGVATVITSLWEVEDFAAREWMDALYDAKWKRGLPTADAMRDACQRVLRARRERGQSDHPSAWANFMAVGDWR